VIDLRVWLYGTTSNTSVVLRSDLDYFNKHFIGKALGSSWVPPEIRISNTSKKAKDFISWMLQVIVCSERALSCLRPLLEQECEILPLIKVKNKQYYALNVLSLVDCLDFDRSEIVMSPSDPSRILTIKKYAFFEERIPSTVSVFKIPEDLGVVFVRESFVKGVVSSGLTGAAFLDPGISPLYKIAGGEPLNVYPGVPE